jgi:hypothetical protein
MCNVSFNAARNVAIGAFFAGYAAHLVSLRFPSWPIARPLGAVGLLTVFLSAALVIVIISMRDTVGLVENRGRFTLRGLLFVTCAIAFGLGMLAVLRGY